jgi:flagellar basal-body rod protein FlgG
MMNALYTAATGMAAQQLGMDVIANNLANVNTTGFKQSRISFEDLLYQSVGDRNAARRGTQVGMGVAPGHVQAVFTQGDFRETGIGTNIAIEGEGYFQVVLPDGTLGYTRDGSFMPDANGQLVNQSGYRLEPAVVIPQDVASGTVSISPTGQVTGKLGEDIIVLGQIEIATFPNNAGLEALGDNTFLETINSGTPVLDEAGLNGLGLLRQGVVEGSNVSVMTEMIDMITTQRAFESVSKVISTSDEMLGMANAMRR